MFWQDQGTSRDTETEQCSTFIKRYSYTFSFLCLFLYLLATNSLLSFPGYLNYLTYCLLCILLLAWHPSFLPLLLVPLVPDTLRIAIWLCYWRYFMSHNAFLFLRLPSCLISPMIAPMVRFHFLVLSFVFCCPVIVFCKLWHCFRWLLL